MVSLNQTELATDEDKKFKIDMWAKLFKATSKEVANMIASESNDIAIQETAKSLYTLNADEITRRKCEDREKA